jgi:cell division cycle 20-like protein 1 (cofactor of APC complex)
LNNRGEVLLWDINMNKQLRKMGGHELRVGAMAWNSNILATGSRDKTILQRDIRARKDYIIKMA